MQREPITPFKDTFDHLECEAAQCVWEWLIENREVPAVNDGFEDYGSSQQRYTARVIGPYVCRVYVAYEKMFGDYDDAFDWEFVPAVVAALPLADVFEAGAYHTGFAWPNAEAMAALVHQEKAR
jgi:hypothetical protein